MKPLSEGEPGSLGINHNILGNATLSIPPRIPMTNFGPGPASWLVANMEDLSSPLQVSCPSNWNGSCKVLVRIDMMRGHTVDARNPAPPRMFFNPVNVFV